MPRVKFEPVLVVVTLAASVAFQSWPAVVAFVAAAALYCVTNRRDDELKKLRLQAHDLTSSLAEAQRQADANSQALRTLETRLVTVENVVNVSQGMTRF